MHYGMEVSDHLVLYGGGKAHTRIIRPAADIEEIFLDCLSKRLWVRPSSITACHLGIPDSLSSELDPFWPDTNVLSDGTTVSLTGCSLGQVCSYHVLPLGGRPGVVLYLGAKVCHGVPHDGFYPLSRYAFTVLGDEIGVIDREARELTACLSGRKSGDLFMDGAGSYDWSLPALCWEGPMRPAVSYTHYRQLVQCWKRQVCEELQGALLELLKMAAAAQGHLTLLGPWAASLASTFAAMKFAQVYTPKEPGLAIAKALYRRGCDLEAQDRRSSRPGKLQQIVTPGNQ